MRGTDRTTAIWPLSLSQIETLVSAHLGPGRVPGNAHGPCFSRQISMYLAKHVAGWSLPKIGRFYNGRHHTTVLYGVEKIEKLRRADESVDALIEVLTAALTPGTVNGAESPMPLQSKSTLVEAVASRVIELLSERRMYDGRNPPRDCV